MWEGRRGECVYQGEESPPSPQPLLPPPPFSLHVMYVEDRNILSCSSFYNNHYLMKTLIFILIFLLFLCLAFNTFQIFLQQFSKHWNTKKWFVIVKQYWKRCITAQQTHGVKWKKPYMHFRDTPVRLPIFQIDFQWAKERNLLMRQK